MRDSKNSSRLRGSNVCRPKDHEFEILLFQTISLALSSLSLSLFFSLSLSLIYILFLSHIFPTTKKTKKFFQTISSSLFIYIMIFFIERTHLLTKSVLRLNLIFLLDTNSIRSQFSFFRVNDFSGFKSIERMNSVCII